MIVLWAVVVLPIWVLLYFGWRQQKKSIDYWYGGNKMSDTPLKSRGQNTGPKKYSLWEWTRGYAALVLLTPVWLLCLFMAKVVRKLPDFVTWKLLRHHQELTRSRPFDVRIPGLPSIPAYMLRWWKIPRNWAFNIYYHIVLRSDDDTAHHDHPWWSFSLVLDGGYWEHSYDRNGHLQKKWFGPGSMQFRWTGSKAHRLVLQSHIHDMSEQGNITTQELPATTIFITGPVLRRWGFIHRVHGVIVNWVDAYEWDEYCAANGLQGQKMEGYAEQLNPTQYRKD